ncbi:bile acid:sodium symporter family protein [Pseudanabaena sp. FACHB-2040]|uniref:bile acid:sodium symporter family protein n=1 Tax=Pseudanabaena sp. FACHB-2040 TaxID=2692859 RepID=UPI00168A05E8|nr:bile acid:sodium symporter family protein [Pseudanabaena sp. FACHB-2040]MBD2259650.1 bile acid:sodium symporter family protein [Pseudanabaena sp. FACHB-2040]
MESSFLTAVFLPLALFVIMLGMGLGLKPADFTRVWRYPKAVMIGLFAQVVMLPIVGFILVSSFPLPPELAVGVMVLAACPGGPTSNMVTYLAGGNVALSITLTAISSLITVLTIPLVVNLAMGAFLGEGTSLQLPFLSTVLQIAVITVIPVTLGMVLHRYLPQFATKAERGVKWLSLFLLGLIIVGLLLQQRANVMAFFAQVGLVTLALNVVAMALGYLIATLARLDRPSSTAITLEVGIQNGTLAIAIASAPSLLNQPTLAIPAAIYSLLMFVTGGLFAGWAARQR